MPVRAIRILIAFTRIVRGIAESRGAGIAKRAALPDFNQASLRTAIAVGGIAIVASFGHFDDTIAAARIDALVWPGQDVADLHARTIRSFITSADVADGITESAATGHRAARARLTDFEQTRGIAAIAVRRVVVVASFAHFHDAVATTGRHTGIRIRRRFADRSSRRTIGIFVTYARAIERITSAARTRRRQDARFAKLEQTRRRATIAVRGIAVVASFAEFDHVITTTRIDTNIRICLDVAKLHPRTIDIFVAGADEHVAKAARAHGAQETRLAELFQALRIAAVAIDEITVVATFTEIQDVVAAADRNTFIGSQVRFADTTARAIFVAIAGADVPHGIAEVAGARISHVGAGLADFEQAELRAAVAIVQIAIVATFAHIEHVISARRIDTRIGRGVYVANLGRSTIGRGIASADISVGIAITADANDIGQARLTQLREASGIATIARSRIAIVATFACFENAVATSRGHANIRVWRGFTELSRRTIRIRIASTFVPSRITKSAGTCRARAGTKLTEFETTNAIATIAVITIAIVASFSGTFLAIATNAATRRPTRDGIGQCRVQSSAHRSAGTIGAELRRIRRATRIMSGIGRVEPCGHERPQIQSPIQEEIGRIAKHARGIHHFGMSHGRRQWIRRRN